MPVGCRATPRARWAVGWVSGATPLPASRSPGWPPDIPAGEGRRPRRFPRCRCRGVALHGPRPAVLAAGQPGPCHSPLAVQIERAQLPRLPAAKRVGSGSAGCSPIRLGLPAPCCGTTAGPAAFAAGGYCQGERHRCGRAQQHRPIGRPARPADPQGVAERSRLGRWRVRVGTGSRRRRGLARGSVPGAGRSRGPG
jgi:hypothetical protein